MVVDGFQTTHTKFAPVVGADNNAFIGQLIDDKSAGLTGASVTNPASVGGAGLAVALDVLQHKTQPHVIKLTPECVGEHGCDAGLKQLTSVHDPKLDPYYSVATTIAPYTTYSTQDMLDCKGP